MRGGGRWAWAVGLCQAPVGDAAVAVAACNNQMRVIIKGNSQWWVRWPRGEWRSGLRGKATRQVGSDRFLGWCLTSQMQHSPAGAPQP